MTSIIKADAMEAASGTNTALSLKGKGSGVVTIGDGNLQFPDADGTNGHFIKTDGSGVLSFAEAGGGGWELVSHQTASTSASISYTSMVTGYDYLLECVGFIPDTDNKIFEVELGIAGPTYRTTGYLSFSNTLAGGTGIDTQGTTDVIASPGGQGSAADETGVYVIHLFNPAAATDTHYKGTIGYHSSSTFSVGGNFNGHYPTAEAHTSIKAAYVSNNIASGEFFLYRRANT